MSEKSAFLIRKLLHKHHLSISEFARMCNLSRSTIYKYLRGEPMKRHSAKKIEEATREELRDWIPYQKFIE